MSFYLSINPPTKLPLLSTLSLSICLSLLYLDSTCTNF